MELKFSLDHAIHHFDRYFEAIAIKRKVDALMFGKSSQKCFFFVLLADPKIVKTRPLKKLLLGAIHRFFGLWLNAPGIQIIDFGVPRGGHVGGIFGVCFSNMFFHLFFCFF